MGKGERIKGLKVDKKLKKANLALSRMSEES